MSNASASPCPGCLSARLLCALIAGIGTFFHLSASTTLGALAAGLSERSEGAGSGDQNAIEALRLAISLVSGWAGASALASAIGVIGVVWNYLPALRLYAIQAVADSIVWTLVVSAVSVAIYHPSLSTRLAPMLCEEISSGDLLGAVRSSSPSRPSASFTLLDVIGSFDQCVERIRPALAFGLLLSIIALIVRARMAAVVWSLYRQSSAAVRAGYAELAFGAGGVYAKSDEGGSVFSDVETDDGGATTPVARDSAKAAQWLAVPTSPHAGKRV